MGTEIKKVNRNYLKDFVEVYRESYKGLEKYAYLSARDIKRYFKWLMSRDPEGFFVAEVNGSVVGFVASDANWFSFTEVKKVGEIHELFVHPSWRRKGIGTTLLLKAINYIKSRGRSTVELWVGNNNFGAISFYRKFGFKEKGNLGRWIIMVLKI